jgi:hypothetical protein
MARLNTNAEVWSVLTQFGVMRDSTGFTALALSTVAEPAGSTGIALSAGSTTLSTGDYIRIGPTGGAEIGKIDSLSTAGVIGLSWLLAEDKLAGAAVVRVDRTDLGDLSDDGVAMEIQTEFNTINAGTQRNAYVHHVAHTDSLANIGLENISWENLLASVGDLESNISGGGTAASPTTVHWLPDNFDTVKPIAFWCQGALKDGTGVEVIFHDCDIDPAKTMNLSRGQDAPLNLAVYPRFITWLKPLA